MDWIKQNKFLSGFLLVLLIVGGALGFLAFSAMGNYDTAYADYQTKAQELNSLQTQQPYPEEANVKKMQELQATHQAAIDSLHKELGKAQSPLKPLTPEKFQDNLRDAVRRVTAKAAERNVQLKEGFYLGFQAYQAVPPKPEAAAPLGRMLEAVEAAINTLLDSRIVELVDIKRDNLPEEGIASPTTDASAKPGQGGKDRDKEKGSELVRRTGFEVHFVSAEAPLQYFLNTIISSKEHFFIPASVSILSEMDKGPSKAETAAAAPAPAPVAAAAPPDGAPAGAVPAPAPAPAPTGSTKFVVGEEKLKIIVRVEIADFAQPATTAAK